jgi:hypothetical protein
VVGAGPHADDAIARADDAPAPPSEAGARTRPDVSGDLDVLFAAGPLFRRVVVGYDRFQVDSYVRWAEDELAAADREREHLVARHLSTRAALDEARELLAHSSAGGAFLRASRRIGALLAAAADEAASMKAEADGDRTAAATEAQRLVASAARVLADAEAEAGRLAAEAATVVERAAAEVAGVADEAERTRRAARAEAAARLEEARAAEQRAARDAATIRRQALEEAVAARLAAREEIVGMLARGREERRRADAAAASRRDALLAEVAALEERRAALRADVDLLRPRTPRPPDGHPPTRPPGTTRRGDAELERPGPFPGRAVP